MSSERRAIGYALMAVLLWSTVATAFKVALNQVSVSQLMAGAAVFSILALMAVLAIRGELKPPCHASGLIARPPFNWG